MQRLALHTVFTVIDGWLNLGASRRNFFSVVSLRLYIAIGHVQSLQPVKKRLSRTQITLQRQFLQVKYLRIPATVRSQRILLNTQSVIFKGWLQSKLQIILMAQD